MRTLYLTKVERTVVSLDRQYDKLRRAFKSKKAAMTEAQKDFVLDHIAKKQDSFLKSISGESKVEEGFKLP